jgi:hypothetical protein
VKKKNNPTRYEERRTCFFPRIIRINHGTSANQPKYPKSAGGKERQKKRMVKKERPVI